MKYLILYAHPVQSDGLSIQGNMLYNGLLKLGKEVLPCDWNAGFQKVYSYEAFQPDVAVGVGCWHNTPQLILHPQKYNVQPVPWLVADGWVANYHDVLSSLPLVLTTSNWVTQTYKRDGVDTKNFRTAHIGFDTELFKPLTNNGAGLAKMREKLGIKEHEKVIMTVGGDVTSKGAQEMYAALAQINNEFKDWKYICKAWGESESYDYHHKEELKILEDLGIKDKVIYLTGGFSTEFMPLFLSMCDVYAAPSRLEGFGMIQVEAQLCGRPVISIDAMGPKDTIVHGKTGYLAKVSETVDLTEEKVYTWMGFKEDDVIKFDEPKTFAYRADINELAEYTHKLLTDDELRKKMGTEARQYSAEKFDYVTRAKHIAELIEGNIR